MRSGLVYTGLLIVLIMVCVGIVSAAPKDTYKTVTIGQTGVDVNKYVSGDTIGWWPSADVSSIPTRTITIPDTTSFDITAAGFAGTTGFWYNLDSGVAGDIALNVVDSYKTVYIGQTVVNVAGYVSGDTIGWWISPEAVYSSPPTAIVTISDKKAFDVSAVDGFLGFWYNMDSGNAGDIALNVVDSYRTVYIGQTGVDVSRYVSGDTIGWWVSPDAVYSTAPSKTITISDTTSFDITAADFTGYTGLWYNMFDPVHAHDIALNVEVKLK